MATNVLVRDMNVVPLTDDRRIEVLANGLPHLAGRTGGRRHHFGVTSHGGRLTRSRMPIVSQARHSRQAAKRKRLRTYPELAVARRCKLLVLGLEVGGRFSREAAALLRTAGQSSASVRRQRSSARPCNVPRCTVGRACWRWRHAGPLLARVATGGSGPRSRP